MAGDEVGLVDQVGGRDRLRPEAEVGDRDPARLLRVVDEVALGVEVRPLADDLHRGLVRPDRSVGAEAEEERLDLAGRARDPELGVDREAEVRDVVVDPDGELPPRSLAGELVEDRLHHRRRELLRGEAVAAADHPRLRRELGIHALHVLDEERHQGLVERLADGARLLRAVEDGDGADRRRQGGDHLLRGERLEEADLEHADLLAGGDERGDGFRNGTGTRAHHDHDALGVGRARVVDEVVAATGLGRQLVHDLLHDAGHRQVERVGRLPRLEEGVGVLGRAADDRGVRVEATRPVREDILVADEGAHHIVVEDRDLVDLVGGPEAVEEVEERQPGPQGGGVAHQGEVVGLLHRACREHRPAGGPGVHDVAVIAEDREGVGRDRPGRDVDDRRRQLAGDLEHVGDHQQEALRRRERRAQGALLEGAVHRARGTSLRLQLHDVRYAAPQVRPPGRRPVVGVLRHRGGGRDRVDRDDLAQGIRHPRSGLVAVEALVPLRALPRLRRGEDAGVDGGPLRRREQGHAGPPIARRRLASVPPSTCLRMVAPMPASRARRASSAPR